jgi:hypothetical protein
MMRRIGVLLIGILGLALILPWGAYWVGLYRYRISQYPLPPPQAISAPQREWVWSLAKVSGEPVMVPLSPYTYLYDLFILKGKTDRNMRVAWWVASDHLIKQNTSQQMLWWHLSGASLTIWLTRNWTDQQITAAAFFALQQRGEVYGGN